MKKYLNIWVLVVIAIILYPVLYNTGTQVGYYLSFIPLAFLGVVFVKGIINMFNGKNV